ncbi:hypothetical protein [Kaistia granuli]|uniref:hypothetical protein n=1 Tax=Kaistia granuli TaxID=363259 RepID=UPI000475915F|nr:hypothetical protein [Kaistia granuli]
MLARLLLGLSIVGLASGSALAASCEQNFTVSGVPMVTAVSYKTWQDFPRLKAEVALKRIAQEMSAQGFSGVRINKQLSTVDAHQETSGSGRIQTLRAVVRPRGKSTRVDAVFSIQARQVTDKKIVRTGLCDIIRSAAR